jgi:hypothetical protein
VIKIRRENKRGRGRNKRIGKEWFWRVVGGRQWKNVGRINNEVV